VTGVTISWEPGGMAKFSRTFTAWEGKLSDLKPLYRQIGDDLEDRIIPHQFESEGGESGGWAPLEKSTVDQKRRTVYGTPKILQRTGDLYLSLISKGKSEGAVWKINAKSAEFGSSLPYGGYHQAGTTKMVKRPPLDISEANREKWVKLTLSFMANARPGADKGAVEAIWSQRMSSGFGSYGVGGKREARGRAEAKSKGRKYGSGKTTTKYKGRSYKVAKKGFKKGRRLI